MKALTVWQPWASLIALGLKPYEFRGWAPSKALQGQRIAIHAGARPVRRAEVRALLIRLRGSTPGETGLKPEAAELLDRILSSPGIVPLSHVVCTAVLGKVVSAREIGHEFGLTNDSDREARWSFAWPMLDVEPLTPPAPSRGMQGLWDWRP